MSSEQLQAIENNIKQSQKIADLGASLERLRSNRDFKKVILEGYFTDEAVRLVHLKADANMQTPESQQAITQQMDSIGSLSQYFRTLELRASMAGKAIASDEAMRDELLAEGE